MSKIDGSEIMFKPTKNDALFTKDFYKALMTKTEEIQINWDLTTTKKPKGLVL